MILTNLLVRPEDLKARTGWEIKHQGACKGEICVPLPTQVTTSDGLIEIEKLAERLRMPLVRDETAGLWSLGPESGGNALTTAVAPDFELPDRYGQPFRLSSLRGRKVFLLTWASW